VLFTNWMLFLSPQNIEGTSEHWPNQWNTPTGFILLTTTTRIEMDKAMLPLYHLSDKMHGTQSVTQFAQADLVSHVTDRMVSTWWNRVMSSGSVSEVHQPCDRTVSSTSLSRAIRQAAECRKSRSASVFCCRSDSIPCPAHQTTCTSSRFSIIHTLLLLLLLQPFNGHFSRTTWVSQYQKGKNSLDLNEARDNGDFGRQ